MIERLRSSFRDPAGRVVVVDGRVFRILHKPHDAASLSFLESAFFCDRAKAGQFPATYKVEHAPAALTSLVDEAEPECILEHSLIAFPAYAHEWPPSMLYDAGHFTLDLAESALAHGWSLKDATPWNVLYTDGRPVFCDVLSFEPRAPARVWLAYAQFQRTFVLPLYAHHRFARPVHSVFRERRDGLEPTELEPVLRGWRRWALLELQTIVLPAKFSRGSAEFGKRLIGDGPSAGAEPNERLADYVLRRSLRRLRAQLTAVRPRRRRCSRWVEYGNDLAHYRDEDRKLKSDFVRLALIRAGAGRVLDIGTNSGEYSVLAASLGSTVVAADFDVASLEQLYERVKLTRLPITPVVLDIARPTPGVGWANTEIASFLVRARGQFRVVMMLAVLHHLIVTERVPLGYVLEMLFELDARFLIIEWVDPADPRFRQIARTHGELYSNLSIEFFERNLARYFRVIQRLDLGSKTRTLYLCERR